MNPLERAHYVRDHLASDGLFTEKTQHIAPKSFALSSTHVELIEKLGLVLHRFNQACNLLYRQSVAGKAHPWVAPLLDAGKPPEMIALARHDKVKGHVAAVICPDLILTGDGFALSELEPVPGGIGLTAWLGETYTALGDTVLGGKDGMRTGFESILNGGEVLISRERADQRPGMEWLIGKDRVRLVEDYTPSDRPAYRLFDALDFPSLPKFKEAWQPGQSPLTPPLKPYLEEKLWLALFWSRPLQGFWRQEVGENGQKLLQKIIPYSWVLDPAPLPPYAIIPELNIQSWEEMTRFPREERELVLKISGFHPDARGVHVGSEMSDAEWAAQVRAALAEFSSRPRVLQRFVKGTITDHEFVTEKDEIVAIKGTTRVSPYYFVVNDRVSLGGVRVSVSAEGSRDAIISAAIAA
jgi:hypothetical protein